MSLAVTMVSTYLIWLSRRWWRASHPYLLPLNCEEHGQADRELLVIKLQDPHLVNVDVDLEGVLI